jgi:hypothetical protein
MSEVNGESQICQIIQVEKYPGPLCDRVKWEVLMLLEAAAVAKESSAIEAVKATVQGGWFVAQ